MDSFENVIRKKITERMDSLRGAIAASEFFLSAYDEYLDARRCVFDFDEPDSKFEEMPLKIHGEILSLKSRLSLYTKSCFRNGLEANFPDFLYHEKKQLNERIEKESENPLSSLSGFELGILREMRDECITFQSMIDSAFNETAFDDDSPCYVDENENVDDESQGGDA